MLFHIRIFEAGEAISGRLPLVYAGSTSKLVGPGPLAELHP